MGNINCTDVPFTASNEWEGLKWASAERFVPVAPPAVQVDENGEKSNLINLCIKKNGNTVKGWSCDRNILFWFIQSTDETPAPYTVDDAGVYVFEIPDKLPGEVDTEYNDVIVARAVDAILDAIAFVEKYYNRVEPVQGVPCAVLSVAPVVVSHSCESSRDISKVAKEVMDFFLIRSSFRLNMFDIFSCNQVTMDIAQHVYADMTPVDEDTDRFFIYQRLLWFDGFKGFGPRVNAQNLPLERDETDIITFEDEVLARITRGEFLNTSMLVNYLVELAARKPHVVIETPKQKFDKELSFLKKDRDEIAKKHKEGDAYEIEQLESSIRRKLDEVAPKRSSLISSTLNSRAPIPHVKSDEEFNKLFKVFQNAPVDKNGKKILPQADLDKISSEYFEKERSAFLSSAEGKTKLKTYERHEYECQKSRLFAFFPTGTSKSEIEKALKERKKAKTAVQAPPPTDGVVINDPCFPNINKDGLPVDKNGKVDAARAAVTIQNVRAGKYSNRTPASSVFKTALVETPLTDAQGDQKVDTVTKEINAIYESCYYLKLQVADILNIQTSKINTACRDLDEKIEATQALARNAPSARYITCRNSRSIKSEFFKAVLLSYGCDTICQQVLVYYGMGDANNVNKTFSVVLSEVEGLTYLESSQLIHYLIDKFPITDRSYFSKMLNTASDDILDPKKDVLNVDAVRRSMHPMVYLFKTLYAADVHYGNILFPFTDLEDVDPRDVDLKTFLREHHCLASIFATVLSERQINILAHHHHNNEFFRLSEYCSPLNSKGLVKYLAQRIPFLYVRNKLTGSQLQVIANEASRYTKVATPVRALITEANRLPFVVDSSNKVGSWLFNMDELAACSVYKDQTYLLVRLMEKKVEGGVPDEVLDMIINSRPAATIFAGIKYDEEDEKSDSPIRAATSIAQQGKAH